MDRLRIAPRFWLSLAALACGVWSACDPMTPADRNFFKKLDEERAAREARMRSAQASLNEQQLIELVKQAPGPAGEGTMEDWLRIQLSNSRGQVMFPKWSAIRRGSNKQDIQFSYVLIDENNQTRKLQYVWAVDILEMKVEPPAFNQEDQLSSPDQLRADQQERRVRDHEKMLE